ncbi:MAG TPA: ABC transporter substrate-binding protein [Gaiellaceae bacterium]|nr:ABC transporter substrate-binding protein [Gaiellaceae bacterium]
MAGAAIAQASPAAREVKIAIVADCNGPLAGEYEAALAGANAAFSQLAGGTVGGARLAFAGPGCGDGSPRRILKELDRLLVEQDADVLIGPASADEAIAAVKWARSHPSKTIVLGTAASQEPTMQLARRNVFRYHGDAAQWNAGLGEYLYRKRAWRTATVIADDYGPGWTSAAGFIADFCASGGTIAKRLYPPLGTSDYAAWVRQLPAPEAVDGYFWAVGSGLEPATLAFQLTYGPLNAREHAGNARVVGAFVSGLGVGRGLKTPAATAYRRIGAETQAAVDYYRAARAVMEGLRRSKGRAGAPLHAAMPRVVSDPYGSLRLDSRRQAIQDQWVLQVTGQGTKLVAQVPAVDQAFGGVFGPRKLAPGRAFPPCVKRKLPWQGKLRVVRNGKVTSELVR